MTPLTDADLRAMRQRNSMPCPHHTPLVLQPYPHHVCVCNNTMRVQRSADLETLLTAYVALRDRADTLPDGWIEEASGSALLGTCSYHYWESPTDTPRSSYERLHVSVHGLRIWPMPTHWPPIPPDVLRVALVRLTQLLQKDR